MMKTPANLSPLPLDSLDSTHQLLLASARLAAGCGRSEDVASALAGDVDWDLLLAAANWHRLDAMVAAALQGQPIKPPEPVAQELANAFRARATHHLKLSSLILAVTRRLRDAKIPVMVLKGVPLASRLYQVPAMRRSRDLDLLVGSADVAGALACLSALPGARCDAFEPWEMKVLMATDCELKCWVGDELIELQWRFAPLQAMYPLDERQLWQESRAVPLAGHEITVPGDKELWSYLCFHGSKHFWFRWFWLVDLAAWMTREPDQDWPGILSRARSRGHERSLLLGFALAAHLIGAQLPRVIAVAIDARRDILERMDQVSSIILSPRLNEYEVPVSNRRFLANLFWMQPHWSARLAIAWRYLCRPNLTDIRAMPLPRVLYPLYYFTKPLRLAHDLIRG